MNTNELIEYPPLYTTDSKGKTRVWKLWVEGDRIYTEHGIKGGKMQNDCKVIKGKTRTSGEEQARLDARGLWESKVKKGGLEWEQFQPDNKGGVTTTVSSGFLRGDSNKGTTEVIKPMLLQDFTKKVNQKKIVWPCKVQPKLDGVRCVYKDGVFYTRQGNVINVPFVIGTDLILDGELYVHGLDQHRLGGLINAMTHHGDSEMSQEDRDDIAKIRFWVFDVVDLEKTFDTRVKMIPDDPMVVKVDTDMCPNIDKAEEIMNKAVENGYEGVVLRNCHGMYRVDYRSPHVQKMKPFLDAEFEVVGVEAGKGRHAEVPSFVCLAENGRTFNVVPVGTMDDRKVMFDNRDSYVGKKLTVRYQKLSNKGVPVFPTGVGFRVPGM